MRILSRSAALLLVLVLVATACGGNGDQPPDQPTDGADGVPAGSITLWSTENQPDRVAATEAILAAFTEQTGIEVELAAVAEDELPGLMVANAASGDLPDVVYFPLDFAAGWAQQGLIDPAAANAAVEELGRETFAGAALDLATVDGQVVAIPSDGWGQLVIYRRDLFEANDLAPPETFEALEAAAQALHDPGTRAGITLATDPSAVFTQQTFEHLAVANGCHLVNDAGEVTLDTPECVGAVEFYRRLAADYSPGGAQDVESTRATYFAGQAAMVIWSPFILDEMAGLRQDALPTCPECRDDPAYLAKNSGLVGALSGGGSEPAQYGQISYLGVGADANVEAAGEFIRFWFEEAYSDWLAISPEGKFPMRLGTADAATRFVDEWSQLETGVDERAPLRDFYGEEVLDSLRTGVQNFRRWGFDQGRGELVSALYESLLLPGILNDVVQGSLSPEDAAQQMQGDAESLG